MIILLGACSITPGFNDTPDISLLSISADTLSQGSLLQDSLFISLSFTDGDGDLGSGVLENILLIDSRTNQRYGGYRIPNLDLNGAMTGIEGTITIKVYNTCCVFPDNTPPCSNPPEFPYDALTLDIQMIDDSGNMSQVITTPTITLLCN